MKNNNYTEIAQYFSAPILAVLNAEMMATRATVDFIQNVGFVNNSDLEDEDFGELKMITFVYQQPGTGQVMQIKIPLLSLVPIPMLQVNEVEFDFGLQLLRKGKHTPAPSHKKGPISLERKPDHFSACLTKNGEEHDKGMEVKMKISQSDLPEGMARFLNLIGQGLQATPIEDN